MSNALSIINDGSTYSALAPMANLEKKHLFNATAAPDYRLRECVNMEIHVVGIIVELVDVKKEIKDDNGKLCGEEMVSAPRIVMLDKDGKSYTATSNGIYNAVGRIIAMYGSPDTWTEPLVIRPKLLTKGSFNIMTLELV